MKRALSISCLWICLLVLSSSVIMGQDNHLDITPTPQSLVQKNGHFTLNSKTSFAIGKNQRADLKKVAAYFQSKILYSTGYNLNIKNSGSSNAISLQIDKSLKIGNEGYQLTVTPKKVIVKAKTPQGIFYGMQSVMQLLPPQIESETIIDNVAWEIPCVEIKDEPAYGYRGMMLDVCRHFHDVEFVKKQLDIMAMFKMNYFHWHLTDDHLWTIEIKKYPRLAEVGSVRRNADGSIHRGFYTQEQIKEVVAYAAERYITVIPEVELPGHALAALTAYPEYSCTGGPFELRNKWGVEDNVYCAGNDKTFEFLQDILEEVIPLFPGKFFHIGGDECPKVRWNECPKCQKRIKNENLKDAHELQSYFIHRIEKIILAHGKSMIGWDEILEGGLAPSATVMSWRGGEGGIAAASMGHDVIMTPNTYLYFDYYQAKDTENEPFGIGGYLPIERVYSYEPMPASLTPEEQQYIKGVQANLWTEYIATFSHAQYMVLPRWAALCEVQWSTPDKKNYEDFLSRLPRLIKWYDAEGYNYAKHVFDVKAEFNPNPADGTLDIILSTIDNAPVHYTLDGTEPTSASPVYDGVLKVKENVDFSAIAIRPTGNSRVVSEKINFSKSSMKPIVANQPVNKQYEFKGVTTLVDGLKGNGNYKTGRWIAFRGNDMDVTIDFKQPTEISSVAISTCVEKGDWVFDAREFSVEVSDDGTNFKKVASENYPAMKETDKNGIYDHKLTFTPVTAQYVKVIASPEKSIPEWHGGKNYPGFLFVDEITVN